MNNSLEKRKILIYVSGSVAAFKAATVITELRERGAETRVVMTESAQRFITPLTLQSLSGHAVVTNLWDSESERSTHAQHGMQHIALSGWAEMQVCVAASANLIARLSVGMADDAVTTTALACSAPLIIAPAMESAMWEHLATQANVKTLLDRGVQFVGPTNGRLASGKQGEGRMAEPAEIVKAIENLF